MYIYNDINAISYSVSPSQSFIRWIYMSEVVYHILYCRGWRWSLFAKSKQLSVKPHGHTTSDLYIRLITGMVRLHRICTSIMLTWTYVSTHHIHILQTHIHILQTHIHIQCMICTYLHMSTYMWTMRTLKPTIYGTKYFYSWVCVSFILSEGCTNRFCNK